MFPWNYGCNHGIGDDDEPVVCRTGILNIRNVIGLV